MKKILVTGGAGFLGSNLCAKLLEMGNFVYCLDNLYSGSKNNISQFLDNQNFNFIEHDVIEPIDIEVDEIYNLACPASPSVYQKDPIFTLKTSVWGVLNMLELVHKYNAKFLQTSTSEIYGDPLEHPQKESYFGNVNPNGIRSCYDEGKRCAETLICDYHRKYNLDTKIARIFNTYGKNMRADDGRVISNFIIQALKNEPLTVYGKGIQTRSFCYVDDLIDGLIKLMDSKCTEPINLGNENEFKIIDAAKLIIQKTNSKSEIIYKDLPLDDPKIRKPDTTKAKNLLDWQAHTALDDGLDITIKYFKEVLK